MHLRSRIHSHVSTSRRSTRSVLVVAPTALVLAAAAACGSSSSPSGGGGPAATPPSTSAPAAGGSSGTMSSSALALKVTNNPKLGQIVTTGSGVTVYRFDADSNHPSKSNCTGACSTAWPPLPATGNGTPHVSGVTSAAVGEIARPDGTKQLTLDGWPLYTFSGDSGPGSTSGQGSGGTWWAVTPTGGKAGSGGAGSSSSTGQTSGGSGY